MDSVTLAIDGGSPTRQTMLPYGRQAIDESDIAAVVKALRNDLLTTGPLVTEFEHTFAKSIGAAEAVAVSSGTAALHAAMFAIGISPGDEVIVPAMTFAATANSVVYCGGKPIFADVNPNTLLIDPIDVERKITPRTRAIIGVDYAGQPCDYVALRTLANQHGLQLVADACHAMGGKDSNQSVGTLADLNVFSLHPVKHITSGEGGLVSTDDIALAARMRLFRNHGITTDHQQRTKNGQWFYEMTELGFNYRITDFQCALGMSQLQKLEQWVNKRQYIAKLYDIAFASVEEVSPLLVRQGVFHAYHLYVIQLSTENLKVGRDQIFAAMRAEGIGVNVHYVPVHLHPYYKMHFNTRLGVCPVSEASYERILTLPMFPEMSRDDVFSVVSALTKIIGYYQK